MSFWVMDPSSIKTGLVQADLNSLLDQHTAMANLSVSDPMRIDHYKRFVRNFVDAFCLAPDGTLFSLMHTSSLYPEDVLELASGRWRKEVMKRAVIEEDVMSKWSVLFRVMKLPAQMRDYVQFPDLMRYYAHGVRRLVEDICLQDNTLGSVLEAALRYPLDIQEMACNRWRNIVMLKAFLDEKTMDQWYCMIRVQMQPGTHQESIEYKACAEESVEIMIECLISIPDVQKLCRTLWVFPPAVVYSAFVTHAVKFRDRLSFMEHMFYSLNEKVMCHFAPAVWRLVEDVSFNDGTIGTVLQGAQWHSVITQILACTKWKHIVMEQTTIGEKTMGQWHLMGRLQVLANTQSGSKKYELCARECTQVIMEALDHVKDIGELRKTLRIFPSAAVYSTIVTNRIRFSVRFSALQPTPEIWKKTIKGWSKSVCQKDHTLGAWIWDTDRIHYMALKIAKCNKKLREEHTKKIYKSLVASRALRFNIPEGSNLSRMLLGKTPSEILKMAICDSPLEDRELTAGDMKRNYTARHIRKMMVKRVTFLVSKFGEDAIKQIKVKAMTRVCKDVLRMDRSNLNNKKRMEVERFLLLAAAYNARNLFQTGM